MRLKNTIVLLGAIAAAVVGATAFGRQPEAGLDAPRGRLSEVAYLSDADLLSEEWSQQYQAARTFVRARQCEMRAPNPLIYIAPPLGSGAKTPARGRELPLRVSTVSNVPNEYLKDMTALAEGPGVPLELADKLRREIPGNYDKLSERVRLLIGQYDPRECYGRTMQQRRWSEIIDLLVNP